MSKTPSGLIVPAYLDPYDLEIKVMFNTRTGATELRLHSKTLKQFDMLKVAGVLSNHTTELLKGIATNSIKAAPVTEGGTDNGNKSQA